jgi:hypothetical protein
MTGRLRAPDFTAGVAEVVGAADSRVAALLGLELDELVFFEPPVGAEASLELDAPDVVDAPLPLDAVPEPPPDPSPPFRPASGSTYCSPPALSAIAAAGRDRRESDRTVNKIGSFSTRAV